MLWLYGNNFIPEEAFLAFANTRDKSDKNYRHRTWEGLSSLCAKFGAKLAPAGFNNSKLQMINVLQNLLQMPLFS